MVFFNHRNGSGHCMNLCSLIGSTCSSYGQDSISCTSATKDQVALSIGSLSSTRKMFSPWVREISSSGALGEVLVGCRARLR